MHSTTAAPSTATSPRRGRFARRAIPSAGALAILLLKLGAIAAIFGGSHALESSHDVHAFAADLRKQPGITSVVELKGSAKPAGADAAYAVNGGAATVTFEKSFGKVEVGGTIDPSPTDTVDYQAAIEQVEKDDGFKHA